MGAVALRPPSPRAAVGSVSAAFVAAAVPVAIAFGEPGVAIGLLALIVLAFALWSKVGIRRDSASPLMVDLDGDSARYEHYGAVSYRRVRVCNRSANTMRNVRVQFERCEQQQIYQVLLQRMHGEPHPFDLDPGADAYLDLVFLQKDSDHYGLGYSAGLLPAGTSNAVRVQTLDLIISVTATDTGKSLHGFAVSVKDGVLHVLNH